MHDAGKYQLLPCLVKAMRITNKRRGEKAEQPRHSYS